MTPCFWCPFRGCPTCDIKTDPSPEQGLFPYPEENNGPILRR